ncbi:YwiC-like family protein [Bifidobacterium tissieri]|nr:YwiC-like family protein [Bifidobacterium tissieri]
MSDSAANAQNQNPPAQPSLPQPSHHKPSTPKPLKPLTVRDWIPSQPGAWAMAIIPALAGVVLAGANVTTIWLLICWILCYCVQYTTARWLKSRYSRRYLPPTILYTAVLAVIGIPFVIAHPDVLLWAPPLAVLALLSFVAAKRRQERSIWANIVVILAACCMTVIICWIGPAAPNGSSWTSLVASQWTSPPLPADGMIAALILALYEFGSVLFVKTMIRERGNRAYLFASWIWHMCLVVGGFLTDPWLCGMGLMLLARSIILPLVDRRRKTKPVIVGMTELVTILMTFVVVIITVPAMVG